MEKLNWYCIQSKPRKEREASASLSKLEAIPGTGLTITTCLPKILACIQTKYRNYEEIQAFFPSYFFAQFVYTPELFHLIKNSIGVNELIRQSGAEPTIVDDELIESLQSRMNGDGFITVFDDKPVMVYSDLKPDELVRIEEGPLAGFTGLFKRSLNGGERVSILLNIMGREKEVPFNRTDVRQVNWSEDYD